MSWGACPPFGFFLRAFDFFPPRLLIEHEGSSWRVGGGELTPPSPYPPCTPQASVGSLPNGMVAYFGSSRPVLRASGLLAVFAFALIHAPILVGFRGCACQSLGHISSLGSTLGCPGVNRGILNPVLLLTSAGGGSWLPSSIAGVGLPPELLRKVI